jgi:hypothetical protein
VPAPRGRGAAAHRQANPLSILSQWKLADNLRRSLVPAALVALLVLGWTALLPSGRWTALLVGIVLLPAACAALVELFRKPDEALLGQHLSAVLGSTARRAAQLGFEFACLPFEALYSLDAIGRTLWRLGLSHRRLLEWCPSSEVEQRHGNASREGLAPPSARCGSARPSPSRSGPASPGGCRPRCSRRRRCCWRGASRRSWPGGSACRWSRQRSS